MKVGSLTTALYTSPHATADLDPEPALLALINGAKISIYASIYSLTLASARDALIAAARRGVTLTIVADASEAATSTSLVPQLVAAGLNVRVWGSEWRLCHAKLGVFDGKTVCLGSWNWTNAAEVDNVEIFTVHTGVAVTRGVDGNPSTAATCTSLIETAWNAGRPYVPIPAMTGVTTP